MCYRPPRIFEQLVEAGNKVGEHFRNLSSLEESRFPPAVQLALRVHSPAAFQKAFPEYGVSLGMFPIC